MSDSCAGLVPNPLLWFEEVPEGRVDEGLRERSGGSIFAVSLLDSRYLLHICSLTPSYELHLLDYVPREWPDDEEEAEALWEELREVTQDDVVFYTDYSGWFGEEADRDDLPEAWTGETGMVRVYPSGTDLSAEWEEILEDYDGSRGQAHAAFMEKVKEDLRCNSRY